jgi:DNA-binding IclR family transcriptional regulator
MPSKQAAPDAVLVKAIVRAAEIMRLFDVQQPELSMAEIQRALGIGKSAAFRLVSTLEAVGLLDQNPETGKYSLGADLIGLAGQVFLHREVRRVASYYLQKLAETARDTANLAVLIDAEVVNLEARLPPGQYVVTSGWVGRRSSLHASATGKVLLAWLPEGHVSGLLEQPLTRYTPQTITSFDTLLGHLAEVRRQGYATGVEEFMEGVAAVAAPVRDHTSQVIAAVSVSGPAFRITPGKLPELSALVCETATLISRELGYQP